MAEQQHAVFISYIAEEAAVAQKLKELIEATFGEGFAFLAAVDLKRDWRPELIRALASANVIVALLSPKSVEARWVNFEVGVFVGAHQGSDAVLLAVFRGLGLGQIGDPLSRWIAADLHDQRRVLALLDDIAEGAQTDRVHEPSSEEIAQFVAFVCEEEKKLPATDIVLLPRMELSPSGIMGTLHFRLENKGSSDVALTKVEAGIPNSWNWSGNAPSLPWEERRVGSILYRYIRYETLERRHGLENLPPLPPTIPAGDHADLLPLVFEVKADLPEDDKNRVFGPELDLEGKYSFDTSLGALVSLLVRSTRMPTLFLLLAVPLAATLRTDIEFAQVGDVHLTLDAWLPDGAGPFAAVIVVHGGGFVNGDKQTYVQPLFDPLTKGGFAWFTINYRLAPQYRFPAAVEDVERAVLWLHAHAREYRVDPRRIALMGESAGGHLVSYVGARHKPAARIAAVVSFYGPHDFEARATQRGALSDSEKAFVGVSDTSPESMRLLRLASPITYVHRDMPPYLLIHGTKDAAVPYELSVSMCDKMKRAGASCEVFTVENAPHGVGSWEKDLAFQGYKTKMVEWLQAALR